MVLLCLSYGFRILFFLEQLRNGAIQERYITYGGVLEMPQKVCGGDILHVMAFARNFWNAPKSNSFSFSLFSVRKLNTCLIFEMPHFFKLEIFEMPHFRMNIGSNASNVWNRKKRKTETVRFWGISKIYANAITCKISLPQTFWGISSTLPYFRLTNLKSFSEFNRICPQILGQEMNDDIGPVGSNRPSNNEKESFLLEYEGPTQLYKILHHR